MLHAHQLHFRYGGRSVLKGVSFHLAAGEVVSLLGANGAGKSTLLRLLLGLIRPDQGEVTLDGTPIGSIGRRQLAQALAYVPQAHQAPFPYTVEEVVTLGRLAHRGLLQASQWADRQAVQAALQRLGIVHLAQRPYTDISGGERQLALIARALAQGARFLVMDEPVSGLDYGHQMRLLSLLRELAREGYAIIKSTHHPEHALLGSTRVIVLQEGQIRRDDTPERVLTNELLTSLYGVGADVVILPDGRTALVHQHSAPDA